MSLETDLEFQRLSAILRPLGWEVTEQKIVGDNLLVVVTKKRPAEQGAPAPGRPIQAGPG